MEQEVSQEPRAMGTSPSSSREQTAKTVSRLGTRSPSLATETLVSLVRETTLQQQDVHPSIGMSAIQAYKRLEA